MGLFDSFGDIVKPIGSLVLGGLGSANQGRTADRLVDWYRDRADQDYARQKQEYDAAVAYNQQAAGAAAANRAAAAANARARAGAANATEKNRQGALKKGMKREQKGFKLANAYLQPWHDTGQRLLPKVENMFGMSMDKGASLLDMLTNAEGLSKLNRSTAAYNVDIPGEELSELFRAR